MAFEQGNYEQALNYLNQSLAIRRRIGDRRGEGATLNNISQVHEIQNNYSQALHYLEQSLKIAQQIGDLHGEGTALGNIGQIYSAQGDYEKTLQYIEQSFKIAQQINDQSGMATTLTNAGVIYLEQYQDVETAVPLLLNAYSLFKYIGWPTANVPESYLNAIIGQIGEERFTQILQSSQNNS